MSVNPSNLRSIRQSPPTVDDASLIPIPRCRGRYEEPNQAKWDSRLVSIGRRESISPRVLALRQDPAKWRSQ